MLLWLETLGAVLLAWETSAPPALQHLHARQQTDIQHGSRCMWGAHRQSARRIDVRHSAPYTAAAAQSYQ